MKGYKAFNSDMTCLGFQYEVGKTYELNKDEKLVICKRGFHFCKNLVDTLAYYNQEFLENNYRVAEVEALGNIVKQGTKYATDKICIVREIPKEEMEKIFVDDNFNSGNHNTGMYNSGACNAGNYNSGNCNTGDRNTGNRNTGRDNTGRCNSGHYNSGDRNTGHCNSGHYNTGTYNSGDWNTGEYNSGYHNTGLFNSGDYNTGMFNTDEPPMRMFNKPCGMTRTEFVSGLDYDLYRLLYHIAVNDLLEEDYDRIKALPNFDPKIFKEITGIDI